jgi:hypothetical protein
MAEREGCAHPLRSFRLPPVAEPIPLPRSGKDSHPSFQLFTLPCIWRRERDVLIRFAPSASLRSPNQFPSPGRGRVLTPHSSYLHCHVYGGERGIRTLDPVISGIHDFQSCPFGLSGISPLVNHLQLYSSRRLSASPREGCARSARSAFPFGGAEPSIPLLNVTP